MWTARLSERHLTLVFHLLGAKQEGISREEMAATGKTNCCVIWTVMAVEWIWSDLLVKYGSAPQSYEAPTSQRNINKRTSNTGNVGVYCGAWAHILLRAIQTAGLLCQSRYRVHKAKCLNVCMLRKAAICVASKCWLCWVGDRERLDMRSGSVDRNMLSFNRNCYLQTIHLVNRSVRPLAPAKSTANEVNNGVVNIWMWMLKKKKWNIKSCTSLIEISG